MISILGHFGQSRMCFNSVLWKMSQHGRFSVPQRLREGQNGVCFNSFSWKMDGNDDLTELKVIYMLWSFFCARVITHFYLCSFKSF